MKTFKHLNCNYPYNLEVERSNQNLYQEMMLSNNSFKHVRKLLISQKRNFPFKVSGN